MTNFNVRQDVHPQRKILVIVTVGGSTNSAPILEICKILHSRGHSIEFATLAERENLVKPYPFVSAIHTVGRPITKAEEEEFYLRACRWSFSNGQADMMKTKKFFDSFWTSTYHGLKRVVAETRPDFIFADYQVDAARDVMAECNLPLATMWPQMPWRMLPQPWIPGEPGMQQRCLTSEHASMWDRLYDETYVLRSARHFLGYLIWLRKMRRDAGVNYLLPALKKPNHLLFVNSFFGLEVPKDLPPLVAPVGPVLADRDDIPPLDADLAMFLGKHTRVLYVAFGTHVILPFATIQKIAEGISMAMRGHHIDAVVWAVRATARTHFDGAATLRVADINMDTEVAITYTELLENKHARWKFVDFAPQRAVLEHPATCLFLTHAGPSSANESIFHGVPMIAMGIYGDQLPNSMRLQEAGVAECVKKETVTAPELAAKITAVVEDVNGLYRRNVVRMQRVAAVASRRKELAADLIEEVMYDHELRFECSPHEVEQDKEGNQGTLGRGKELRHMHLQTADMRMSWMKARNLDLVLLFLIVFLVFCAVMVLIGLGGARVI
ncbi:putative UDP-glucoronosyl and UDP-glucosyl transferase family protein [Sphaerosporella brunnea]|uniref:Putative UDP-glucoronosyl and UDP-glucosyl transferase family protein n=1 Tax=Sphaerosporella brunnea TaxID=1250544 RepID=A0A5J5EW66_9PEZI|nr:putative UDP-glucoronosyl and UDP-glucosyl transferase family protein [Sphaerosporella brunnea]